MPLQCGTCTRALFSCGRCGHTGCANSYCSANAFEAAMRCPRCGGMAQMQSSLGNNSAAQPWGHTQQTARPGGWNPLDYGDRPKPQRSPAGDSLLAPLVMAGVQALVRAWQRRQAARPPSSE